MSERFKYSLNGVYRCENFAQHLANNSFTPQPIGAAWAYADWYIKLETDSTDELVIYPWIYSEAFNCELRIKCYFSVLKKDGSTAFCHTISEQMPLRTGPCGLDMHYLELLNGKNGYLDDEALVIEYGLQVESILVLDDGWIFNPVDSLFNSQEKKNMITFPCPSTLNTPDYHVHKLLFAFHSSYFYEKFKKEKGNWVELLPSNHSFYAMGSFLQIAQGVQVSIANHWTRNWCGAMNIANHYSMKNVIRYYERQLIENDLKSNHMKEWVIYLNILRHYLVHLLKNVKSPREMIDETDIGKMKGETMKIFIAKFLYNKF